MKCNRIRLMRDLWLIILTESISRESHLDRIPPNQATIRVKRDAIENEENNRGTGDADLHDSHSIEKSAGSILKCTTTIILGNCTI